MDETTQETVIVETESQAVETVAAETEPQVVETVAAETESLPAEDVPATSAVTVPAYTPTFAPLDIYYGEDFTLESTAESTEVVEATESVGIPERIEIIDNHILGLGEALNLIAGMLLFFTVITLCYFVYKFFRIFF